MIKRLLSLILCTLAAAGGSYGQSFQTDSLPAALTEPDTIPTVPDSLFTTPDTLSWELPESFSADVDSMLHLWYSAFLPQYDSACLAGSVNPTFSDSVYAWRLSTLPTVIDMPYNYYTKSYIESYMGKNRNLVAYAAGVFPLYDDIFTEAMLQWGVPVELKYLAIVESALKPNALSRMGAAGLWQFIYSTGRNYGLKVNSLVDDRYDIRKETAAAARHLSDLYGIFGDWSLAIAAYNCGAGGVSKAITRSGGKRDFWEIYPYLPRETRGYLPSFIAVNYAMNFYQEHGICPVRLTLDQITDTLQIWRNLHFEQIMHFCDITEEELKRLNPQYLTSVIPGTYKEGEYYITLPSAMIRPILEAGDSLYEYKKEEYFSKSKLAYIDDEIKNRNTYILHKIQSGETLSTIARKYHTTVAAIKRWNNLTSDNIRAGKSLRIYNK